jgi:hypothetical protein
MEAPAAGAQTSCMADPSSLHSSVPWLLDDRSRPDFRDHYLALLEDARGVSVAASRIRLAGLQLDAHSLRRPGSLRVLVMELSGIALAMEAERVAEGPPSHRLRVTTLRDLLNSGRLQVRSSPLGGWNPDFTVFRREGDPGMPLEQHLTVAVGPHWMDRPYPHPGPALNAFFHGRPALRSLHRFEELWDRAHDVGDAVARILAAALVRTSPPGMHPDRVSTPESSAADTPCHDAHPNPDLTPPRGPSEVMGSGASTPVNPV